ncbi:MAG TPA: Crp/Fnr family transcriptional regulator [Xanthobacteraceae bacterium]|nr:Crp/Fnr family transcriptional regulator [Xanthobacteraceae bacterium]
MRTTPPDARFTLFPHGERDAGGETQGNAHRATVDAVPQVHNRLLRRLPPAELQTLLTHAKRIELHPRQILHHWNMPMREVFFIEQGLVSVSVKISRERAVEGWLIGSEGMTGIPLLLGDHERPPYRRVVQVGGSALRLAAGDLLAAVRELETLRGVLLRYVQFVLCQSSQWGACNAHHSLKQRMGRWLLAARDGVESDRLPVTHQLLARLLGVRRASVSECLSALEAEGIIRNTRSLVEIARPEALMSMSCDCYRVVQRDYQRLLENGALRDSALG